MIKFKVGDRVKVNPESPKVKKDKWASLFPFVGEIMDFTPIISCDDGEFIEVGFPKGDSFPFLEDEILFADEDIPKEKKEIIKRLYREIHAIEAEIFNMFMETQ